jgi:hypothetical protein
VTIRRATEDVFGFLAYFENIPTWNYATCRDEEDFPGTGGCRNHLPTNPFHSHPSEEASK